MTPQKPTGDKIMKNENEICECGHEHWMNLTGKVKCKNDNCSCKSFTPRNINSQKSVAQIQDVLESKRKHTDSRKGNYDEPETKGLKHQTNVSLNDGATLGNQKLSGSFNNSQIQEKIFNRIKDEIGDYIWNLGDWNHSVTCRIVDEAEVSKFLDFLYPKIKQAISLALSQKDEEIKELKQAYKLRNDDAKDYEKNLSIKEEIIEDLKQKLLEKINKMKGIKVNSIPVRKDDGEFISKDELLTKIKELI